MQFSVASLIAVLAAGASAQTFTFTSALNATTLAVAAPTGTAVIPAGPTTAVSPPPSLFTGAANALGGSSSFGLAVAGAAVAYML